VEFLSEEQQQVIREQFPQVADLRNQVHLTYWSEQHLVTQDLLCQLPFGRILSATTFYRYTDFQLEELVTVARRNFVLWALIGIRQYNGSLINQIALFHNETFLWHYSVPPNREAIITQIQGGNRIRFLSRFYLSQAKIELEFSKIQLLSISGITPQLVYADSKEYTYNWLTNLWTTGITNYETTLINPRTYTLPILIPNTSGHEIEYQGYLNHIQTHNDLILTTSYWGSVESTEVPSLHSSCSSTPESEYLHS
jgi:hypothetical protein